MILLTLTPYSRQGRRFAWCSNGPTKTTVDLERSRCRKSVQRAAAVPWPVNSTASCSPDPTACRTMSLASCLQRSLPSGYLERPPPVINDRKFAVCLSNREQTRLPSRFSRTRFSRFRVALPRWWGRLEQRERERERETQAGLYDHCRKISFTRHNVHLRQRSSGQRTIERISADWISLVNAWIVVRMKCIGQRGESASWISTVI